MTDLCTYSVPYTAEIAGATSATQLPTNVQRPVKRVTFEACASNTGNVYIGFTSGVTKPDGTSDITTGVELVPSQAFTCYMPHTNIVYYICDNATDDFILLLET